MCMYGYHCIGMYGYVHTKYNSVQVFFIYILTVDRFVASPRGEISCICIGLESLKHGARKSKTATYPYRVHSFHLPRLFKQPR